jgi:hypothetical protein
VQQSRAVVHVNVREGVPAGGELFY